jgi:hypothetical protein
MTLTAVYDAAKVASSQASVNTLTTYVDTEVAAIKAVTDKLDTALEIDGAVYRYTANALEQAPTGSGGGGATDWSPSERDQIRSRLGLDGSSAVPTTANPLASQVSLLAVKGKTDALPPDPADASDIAASFTTINTKIDGVKTKTDNLPSDPADASDIAASFTVVNGKLDAMGSGASPMAIADAVLTRDWTQVSGETPFSILNALRAVRNAWKLSSSGLLTIYKEDGTTVSWQRSVHTDAAAQPIVGAD